MKAASRYVVRYLFTLLFVAFCAALTVQAQTRDKYVISASAGGVNFVVGNVTVQRKSEAGQRSLSSEDDLEAGDVVTTGRGGRVEVLLNPGSYLRVEENSEFEISDTALDNLRIKLTKGSAIVEVTGADGYRLTIEVITPQTKVAIIRRGLYRLNVLPTNVTEVLVSKGRAVVGEREALTLKGDQKATVFRSNIEVAKFDKKNRDSLDVWSKQRAESLAKANQSIKNSTLMASLRNYDASWSGYDSYGIWVYNRRFGCYSFYPFNPWGWSSPYGYSYNGSYPCRGCGGGYQPRPNPDGSNPGNGGGSGGGSGGGGGNNTTPPPSGNPSPGSGRRGPREPMDDGPSNPGFIERGGGGGGSAPMPSAPVRETPAPSMPAPSSPPPVNTPARVDRDQ